MAKLSDVADFERYLEDLTRTVKTATGSGANDEGLVAAALPTLKAKYGTWTFFDQFAPAQIRFMEAELAGTKHVPTTEAVPAGNPRVASTPFERRALWFNCADPLLR